MNIFSEQKKKRKKKRTVVSTGIKVVFLLVFFAGEMNHRRHFNRARLRTDRRPLPRRDAMGKDVGADENTH
jgi:hypothetical protein